MPTTTNNMGLKIPIAGETDYATSVSDSFTAIDSHDHSSSKGVQIPTNGIEDGAVTISKLPDGVLANSTAGRAKMADGFLSADSAGRAKMADGFVNAAKKAALGQSITSTASFSTSSTTEVDVTGLSIASFVSNGRPLFIGLIPGTSGGYIGIATSFTEDDAGGQIFIYEDSTAIAVYQLRNDPGSGTSVEWRVPPSIVSFIHPVTAGTRTYKIRALVNGSNRSMTFSDCKLVIYEL